MTDETQHADASEGPEPQAAPSSPPSPGGPPGAADDVWDVPKRISVFVVSAPVIGVGVWLLQEAFAYSGPVLLIMAFIVGASLVLAGGAVLVAMGIVGVPRGKDLGGGPEAIEQQAARLGLPADPQAYQDGGVGVAATARTVAEAEMIASLLSADDIPAWADQPHSSTVLWYAPLNPAGVRVMVPLGRLEEARGLVAAHRAGAGASDAVADAAEAGDEPDAAADLEAPEASREPPEGARRQLVKTAAAIFLLFIGLGMALPGAWMLYEAIRYEGLLGATLGVVLTGGLGLGLCAAGIVGLRRRRAAGGRSQDGGVRRGPPR